MKSQSYKKSLIKPLGQIALLFSLLGMAWQASAQTKIEDAWIRATVPGQQSTGAFLKVTSSTDSKLVNVQSPAAKMVQIHRTTMQNEVMHMDPVDSVALPAGKTVVFDPSGYHVMFIGLSAQVKEGDKVPLTLTVEDATGKKESVKLDVDARALNASDSDDMK
ncbi:copper(I)-binding protein [Pseudomonas frederiksbergensis]|jgi:copper(I)-binding protein|uniref:Transporter n=1 Tax=Pseudomonas fluorescens TaxID=294 RepID=A0A159ZTW7_PSEFL|nr:MULTISPECIES: copper chaperone PCu(A)C [Pseudomonas]AMZ70420.1 transporter [Pseudomonas fluorescens]